MRVREFETYKAVYCSLCRELGKSYGLFARFTLSYDFAFLALLRLSVSEHDPHFIRKRCAFNPLLKCKCCKTGDELKFSAAAAMVMIYYHVRDNLADRGFFKKMGSAVMYPFCALALKKAVRQFPEIDDIFKSAALAQRDIETQGTGGIDAASMPTAQALSALFSLYVGDESRKRVLARLGFCLGKWIYMADAVDDVKSDLKRGDYNPYIAGLDRDDPGGIQKVKESAVKTMNVCVYEAGLALALLEPKRFQEILHNIIMLGCQAQQRFLLHTPTKTKEPSS